MTDISPEQLGRAGRNNDFSSFISQFGMESHLYAIRMNILRFFERYGYCSLVKGKSSIGHGITWQMDSLSKKRHSADSPVFAFHKSVFHALSIEQGTQMWFEPPASLASVVNDSLRPRHVGTVLRANRTQSFGGHGFLQGEIPSIKDLGPFQENFGESTETRPFDSRMADSLRSLSGGI